MMFCECQKTFVYPWTFKVTAGESRWDHRRQPLPRLMPSTSGRKWQSSSATLGPLRLCAVTKVSGYSLNCKWTGVSFALQKTGDSWSQAMLLACGLPAATENKGILEACPHWCSSWHSSLTLASLKTSRLQQLLSSRTAVSRIIAGKGGPPVPHNHPHPRPRLFNQTSPRKVILILWQWMWVWIYNFLFLLSYL